MFNNNVHSFRLIRFKADTALRIPAAYHIQQLTDYNTGVKPVYCSRISLSSLV